MARYDLEGPVLSWFLGEAPHTAGYAVKGQKLSRRQWLRHASLVAGGLPVAFSPASTLFIPGAYDPQSKAPPTTPSSQDANAALFPNDPTSYRFTRDEDQFLDELQRACFQYFWDEVNPNNGLVKDRSQANGPDSRNVASIAATGFALTALCIADHRGWQDHKKIRDRVALTLRFVDSHVPQAHGFLCHFLRIQNGDRVFQSEVSSIDTAIFICGALTCRAYFDDPEIHDLATRLFERIDWNWMLHGEKTLSMGWTPERGFIRSRWDSYSELMMVYLLGLGSSATGTSKATWDAWTRPYFEFNGIRYIGSHAPLFVHQYSHAWFDFQKKRDKYADYFVNSMIATKVHKIWCLELAREFPDYSEDFWGITASDSSRGYAVWGGPPAMGRIDGTVVPCATGGSLPFLPEETVRVLRNIREKYERRAWRKYGFVDALNPLTNWYSQDVVGIDVGITLVMAENARSGFVWEQFMKNDVAKTGMNRAGFHVVPGETPATAKFAIPKGFPLFKIQ